MASFKKNNRREKKNIPPHEKSKSKNPLVQFWEFLKSDTWQSWLVSLILAFVIIKFVFFPLLSFALSTPLPLVVVESCSMYHSTGFDDWWQRNSVWYETHGIQKSEFREFPFKGGLNKGDIIIVSGRGGYDLGDVIIFEANFRFPLIHRIVADNPYGTKGDNNLDQIPGVEDPVPEDRILGKSIAKVPYLGWLKLIFFEGTKQGGDRGLCKARE